MEGLPKSAKECRSGERTRLLADNPQGDKLLLYIESKDIQKTFMTFSSSKDPFDLWFVEEMKKNTGVDFSQPMSGPLPELLISFDKSIL